jgi:subtilisin family serine protease
MKILIASQIMNRLFLILVIILLLSQKANGQDKYFVSFIDKNGTPYSVENPEEFLSQKSIERRVRQGIEITEKDLPVSPEYIEQVQGTGATVLYPLKWFNGILVETSSNEIVQEILNLDPVLMVEQIFEYGLKAQSLPDDEFFPVYNVKEDPKDYYNYGSSSTQIKMLSGHSLHNLGYRGKGMTIAVLDAGFFNVNSLPAFDSLNTEGRLIFTRDYVNPNSNIYEEHTHGMIVLSAMAGNIPGQLIGTAPEADYILIRTEDGLSEQIIEEYNWAAGAELADSLGADVINSSLGYYTFDAQWQNHVYEDMDGQTTPVALAANIAAEVGMLVVASAGNEGNSAWQHIISPSDGLYCIAVGAVDENGQYVSFSSIGPSADGRVKPDVAAMGRGTVVQGTNGEISSASGTSLSAPIISGLATCLWQALPNITVADLRERIHYSSSIYENPNPLIGHGLPNFFNAMYPLNVASDIDNSQLNIFPNPSNGKIMVSLPWQNSTEHSIRVMTIEGKTIINQNFTQTSPVYSIDIPSNYPSGLYLIKLTSKHGTKFGKVILQ